MTATTIHTDRPDLAAEVSTFLRNLHGLNMSIVQQLSPILEDRQGIDLRLYYILHAIDNGAVHPGAIAQAMKLPNSLVTKHLDQLADRELLERSIDSHFRRIRISLTKKGKAMMDSSDDILSEMVGIRLARIPDDRRAGFLATLVELAAIRTRNEFSRYAAPGRYPQERRLTLAALMAVLLLSSLDQTVVGVAMPRIIAELHGLSLIAWLTTAYMLTSTVFVPIYGKLSDLYGRKTILVFGICVFLLGSWACGMSGEFGDLPLIGGGMNQLILFRAVQGVGGAALFTMTFTIIADLFEPRERGKFMGIFASVFGVALVLGPLAGGFFTDLGTVSILNYSFAGWRGVFYVNLPIGLLALFMIVFKMPDLGLRRPGRVDYLGAIFFMAAVTPFLLGLTWGNSYGWLSGHVLGAFAAALISFAIFFLVEVGNPDALMPLALFRNKVFSVANAAGFLVGMAFMGVISFLPLYMQVVRGVGATKSGLSILPLLGGLMATSVLSGFLASKTGRYKPFILGGYIFVMIGMVLLAQIGPDTSTLDLGWRMFVMGVGIGPTQSLFSLAIQNAVPAEQIATATSTSQFFRQIGSTVGVTVFGTMLTGNLLVELPKQLPSVPGMTVKKIDMGEAQSQAMNPNRIHDRIAQAFDDQYALFDRAYHGDLTAVAAVLDNPAVPEGMKTKLRAGDTANADQTLKAIRQALDHRLPDMVAKVERGTKVAFSNSITAMFKNSWAIVFLGIVIVIFLPEVPLRQKAKPEEANDNSPIAAAAAE